MSIAELIKGRGVITFDEMKALASQNGVNAALWLREKHQGWIDTKRVDGELFVRNAADAPEWPVPANG